jgi:hypothetical protein
MPVHSRTINLKPQFSTIVVRAWLEWPGTLYVTLSTRRKSVHRREQQVRYISQDSSSFNVELVFVIIVVFVVSITTVVQQIRHCYCESEYYSLVEAKFFVPLTVKVPRQWNNLRSWVE